jgi:hypothetical protein
MAASTWLFILGAFFIVVSTGFLIWGFKESRDLEEGLSQRYDLREFLERTPDSPQPGALKAGGIIGLAIGVIMLVGAFIAM